MTAGKALGIMQRINDPKISAVEKALAIRRILEMPTHNSVRKDDLLTALRWAITLLFDEN